MYSEGHMHAQGFGVLLFIKSPAPLFRIRCIYYYAPWLLSRRFIESMGIGYSVDDGDSLSLLLSLCNDILSQLSINVSTYFLMIVRFGSTWLQPS